MKILLINPPSLNYVRISTSWECEIGNVGIFPPYGLISLAAYIRKYRNDEIRVLDCIAENYNFEKLDRYLKEFQPSVIGIGSFTLTFYDVLQTARLAKEILPNVHVCIGGVHTQLFPEETISHPEIDSIVLGEGESPFLNLLNCLDEHKQFSNLPSVVCKDTKFLQSTELNTAYVGNLDTLPFPAYDLLNAKHYRGSIGRRKRMVSVCTSRGCPFNCTFCQKSTEKYRTYSVNYVIDMMSHFYSQGYREFYFFDDTFNITTERAIDISEAILATGMKISWIFRGRADKADEEMIKIASKSGCTHVVLGVEDYTNEGLGEIKKGITIDQAKKFIELAHKYGLQVSTNWIIGLPSHRKAQDINNLADLSIRIKSDYAQYTILFLLPGCEMFEEAVREGVIHRQSWYEFVRNPTPDYIIEPYDKYMSLDELSNLYKYCYRHFYRRPLYILKRLIRLRNFYEFERMIKPALNLLFK